MPSSGIVIDDSSGGFMIWQLIDSSSVGGAERHVATLADGLRRTGHGVEIVLLQAHGDNPWLRQLFAAGFAARHLDGRLAGLVKALRAERPRLLHTHGYKAGILGRLAAGLARVPSVSTFHSGERGPFPVGAYEWLDDWTSFLGKRIAVSDKIGRRLPFRATVIPSYIVPPAAPTTAPLPLSAAFVGRFSAEKGPDLFCHLAERAPPGIAWHMYGDGPLRQALERDHAGRVQFHGIATDMEQVWPGIGVLVMPSRFEGVPLAALEATAHGVPVVASRVGGLPTVVAHGETGWLFPAGDIEAALAAVAAWRESCAQGTDGLRAACWRKASAEFSEQRWLPEVMAVYRAAGYGAV